MVNYGNLIPGSYWQICDGLFPRRLWHAKARIFIVQQEEDGWVMLPSRSYCLQKLIAFVVQKQTSVFFVTLSSF